MQTGLTINILLYAVMPQSHHRIIFSPNIDDFKNSLLAHALVNCKKGLVDHTSSTSPYLLIVTDLDLFPAVQRGTFCSSLSPE